MKILLAIFATVLLNGCSSLMKAETMLDDASDKYCAAIVERTVIKTALDPSFRAKDKAVCIRCPGEAALSCAGDPMELPASQ